MLVGTPGIEPLPFRPRDRLLNRRSEATGDAGVCGFAGIYTRDSSQETAAAETAAAETAVIADKAIYDNADAISKGSEEGLYKRELEDDLLLRCSVRHTCPR